MTTLTYSTHKPLWYTGFALAAVALTALAAVGISAIPIWGNDTSFAPAVALFTQNSEDSAPAKPLYHFIEVVDSCNFAYVGECVNVRSGPGETFPVVLRLRTGIVLLVTDTVTQEGRAWYKIGFATPLLYPERFTEDWYVAADVVHEFTNEGDQFLTDDTPPTTKHIVVDLSEQKLYAYDGDTVFMEEPISAGLDLTPTPRGTFTVFKMTPSRFMQGPIPNVSDQVYDLPGVPWDLYFSVDGAVVHGAYWHDHFGTEWSHGCVNLPVEKAKGLYLWADVGMKVVVRD